MKAVTVWESARYVVNGPRLKGQARLQEDTMMVRLKTRTVTRVRVTFSAILVM